MELKPLFLGKYRFAKKLLLIKGTLYCLWNNRRPKVMVNSLTTGEKLALFLFYFILFNKCGNCNVCIWDYYNPIISFTIFEGHWSVVRICFWGFQGHWGCITEPWRGENKLKRKWLTLEIIRTSCPGCHYQICVLLFL